MSGKNLASALQNFRQLAAKNQRIKVKSAEQWAKVREERGREEGERKKYKRREEEIEWSLLFSRKRDYFFVSFLSAASLSPLCCPPPSPAITFFENKSSPRDDMYVTFH